MPVGPVIMSPDRSVRSGAREVIIKKPHIFKIGTLSVIRDLYPSKSCFHAGFGNRDTDAISYLDVGIPLDKIYIINPAGKIHHFENPQTSYLALAYKTHHLFPIQRLR